MVPADAPAGTPPAGDPLVDPAAATARMGADAGGSGIFEKGRGKRRRRIQRMQQSLARQSRPAGRAGAGNQRRKHFQGNRRPHCGRD